MVGSLQQQVNGHAAAVGLMSQANADSAAPAVAQLTHCFNSVAGALALNVTMFLFNAASTHVHCTQYTHHTALHYMTTES